MSPPRSQKRQFRLLIAFLISVAATQPVASAKQESIWTFEVRKLVEHSPIDHEIHLIPAPPGINFPRTCEEFVILTHLESGKGVPFAYRDDFNAESYDLAIRRLQRAQVSKELVRLVSLAGGFGRPEETVDECVVFSSGLAVLLDRDQRPAIFSVF